jgi:hypothetical protein
MAALRHNTAGGTTQCVVQHLVSCLPPATAAAGAPTDLVVLQEQLIDWGPCRPQG